MTWTETLAWTNLFLTALGAFSPITVLMLTVSGQHMRRAFIRALCIVGLLGVLASTAMMFVVDDQLCALFNAYGCAKELVPHFVPVIIAYGVVSAAANVGSYVLAARYDRLHCGEVPAKTERLMIFLLVLCVAVVLVAALGVRLEFYCMHMTAGMV